MSTITAIRNPITFRFWSTLHGALQNSTLPISRSQLFSDLQGYILYLSGVQDSAVYLEIFHSYLNGIVGGTLPVWLSTDGMVYHQTSDDRHTLPSQVAASEESRFFSRQDLELIDDRQGILYEIETAWPSLRSLSHSSDDVSNTDLLNNPSSSRDHLSADFPRDNSPVSDTDHEKEATPSSASYREGLIVFPPTPHVITLNNLSDFTGHEIPSSPLALPPPALSTEAHRMRQVNEHFTSQAQVSAAWEYLEPIPSTYGEPEGFIDGPAPDHEGASSSPLSETGSPFSSPPSLYNLEGFFDSVSVSGARAGPSSYVPPQAGWPRRDALAITPGLAEGLRSELAGLSLSGSPSSEEGERFLDDGLSRTSGVSRARALTGFSFYEYEPEEIDNSSWENPGTPIYDDNLVASPEQLSPTTFFDTYPWPFWTSAPSHPTEAELALIRSRLVDVADEGNAQDEDDDGMDGVESIPSIFIEAPDGELLDDLALEGEARSDD